MLLDVCSSPFFANLRALRAFAVNSVRGFPRRSVRCAPLAVLTLLTGCLYTFNQGGGFPSHIRTIYIESFDNSTVEFGLEQILDQRVTDRIPRALGVRPAGRDNADAVLTGRILRYDDVAQNFRGTGDGSGGNIEVLQHQVQIAVQIRIVDVAQNVILWESQVTGQGLYRPDTQTAQDGRTAAIEQVLQRIIDGAQSQW
jgi:hypothetical protein